MAPELKIDIDLLTERLPDPEGARVFLARLQDRHPELFLRAIGNASLITRIITLAAYSPFLAETMLSNPDYIEWIGAEKAEDLARVESPDKLSEQLARFGSISNSPNIQERLDDFKQRKLMRIYLRDCLGLATLAEVTEELSNLADLIIAEALTLAETEQSRLHGYPESRDAKGRVVRSEMAVIALGKLGCRELNYSSDIDLMFLFSGRGETSGSRASVSASTAKVNPVIGNKEFFTRVAERIVEIVGGSATAAGRRPIYRIDLRLRPYGRDGDLLWEVDDAAKYYSTIARTWERQALIRARGAAGSDDVATRFSSGVRGAVFREKAIPEALKEIHLMRQALDRKNSQVSGFNVKVGIGGIREIEFIAQALQLMYGGREPWIRPTQMLIVLARLAEKGYLSQSDRSRLSTGYEFLRTVEHRIQMEQGAQTHSLPLDKERLLLLAKRCGYAGEDPTGAFLKDMKEHTSTVRAIYSKVMLQPPQQAAPVPVQNGRTEKRRSPNKIAERISFILKQGAVADESTELDPRSIAASIERALTRAINPSRSLRNLTLWVDALGSISPPSAAADELLSALTKSGGLDDVMLGLCVSLGCNYLAGILLPHPTLAAVLTGPGRSHPKSVDEFENALVSEIGANEDAMTAADALRREWYRLTLEIGYSDVSASLGQFEISTAPNTVATAEFEVMQSRVMGGSNRRQTSLAEAVLRQSVRLALNSVGLTGAVAEDLPIAILGLGRLGHCGMDYGSDLDLLIVYDEDGAWPEDHKPQGPAELTARFSAELVKILSSITREGTLYRVDLRLRPEGQSGPIAQSLTGLESYVAGRASAWEHSAYLKLREVAGNLQLGARVRERVAAAAFQAATANRELGSDLVHVRARLEKEKARSRLTDIKWGAGGMTDVYFVTRYLQLRDGIYFSPEQGTVRLIRHLGDAGALLPEQADVLYQGYVLLRKLDHWIRLLSEAPSSRVPDSMVVLEDIARAMRLSGPDQLREIVSVRMGEIRDVYRRVFNGDS